MDRHEQTLWDIYAGSLSLVDSYDRGINIHTDSVRDVLARFARIAAEALDADLPDIPRPEAGGQL